MEKLMDKVVARDSKSKIFLLTMFIAGYGCDNMSGVLIKF
jgi:hypothetical protein